jgi:hypothetical protein
VSVVPKFKDVLLSVASLVTFVSVAVVLGDDGDCEHDAHITHPINKAKKDLQLMVNKEKMNNRVFDVESAGALPQ